MDNASVISLSSTSSKSSSQLSCAKSLKSILTVSSETQRVPVSWESDKMTKKKGKKLEYEKTPNHSEKVHKWMDSVTFEDGEIEHMGDFSNVHNESTCIRYDFDKSTKAASLPKSCYTRATTLFSYMKEAKKTTCVNENGKNTKVNKAESPRPNGINSHKNGDEDTILSPESQKKELCTYLQLMKPDEKQENFFVENRRSVRVKNLTQNNEKKEFKEKLKDTNPQKLFTDFSEYEKIVNDIVNYPTLKSFEELNMKINKFEHIFNLKRKKSTEEMLNKYLPLPPKRVYSEAVDFEDSVKEIVEELKKKEHKGLKLKKKHKTLKLKHIKGCLKKVEKRRKFKYGIKFQQKFKTAQFSYTRINSLRSRGRLRNSSLNSLVVRKSQLRKKARKKLMRELKKKSVQDNLQKPEQMESPRCEIVSVHTNSDDENVDLKNFVDDMLELDKMSEEHRKSVIESRILASSSITNLINKQTTQEADVQRAYKIFSDLSNERKNSEEKENNNTQKDETVKSLVADLITSEHDYADVNENQSHQEEPEEDESDEDEQSVANSLSPVPIPNLAVLPVNTEIQMKSLHRSLTLSNKRKLFLNNYLNNWSSGSSSDNKKLNHSISISKSDGVVLRAFYQDYNLVIAQQSLVSFWTQSALGNVLGSQNMWIPKGQAQRIPLNSTYTQKDAMEMVISTETSVAYVELWTKEHKSEIREVPVADVFATVYFWRLRQNGIHKKALQLENIKGYADDVQYCVLRCYSRIIVSWHSIQGNDKKTKIRSYHLATDFQTVANISEIQPVEHYVSSLHNIEDCDSLVMGCGENKITLWNVEYGYIVATIELLSIKSPLSTLWVKCDRGFLFTIQECVDQELRLIAINGMNHSWKKLQSYNPLPGYDCLKGVCIENGILIAYYSQGILCWNAQTGELIVEEVPNECECIPYGRHVIMTANENIVVRHSLSHLITDL